MRRALLLLLAVVLGQACAHGRPRVVEPRRTTVPEAARSALGESLRVCAIQVGSPWCGRGAPVGPTQILTAGHIAADASVFHLSGRVVDAFATQLWHDRNRDRAMLSLLRQPMLVGGREYVPAVVQFAFWLRIAKHQPEPGEELYYLAPTNTSTPTAGLLAARFVRTDDDGDLVLDGPSCPGASGGPVVNGRGEIVGLIYASGSPIQTDLTGVDVEDPQSLLATLELLIIRSLYRSYAFAKPVWGGFPGPR